LLGESELGREYWTSGRFNTSRWIWTATGEDMKYTNWFVGQPDDNGDTSCALLYFANGVQGLWADNSCRYATHFMCEGDLSY
jgi:Lectin C-type domain